MNAVFADTFFYQALLDERDAAHGRALAQSKVRRTILTTEFILLELGNACARSEDHADFLDRYGFDELRPAVLPDCAISFRK